MESYLKDSKVVEDSMGKRKSFSFLSSREIECPRCGRVEYANAEQGQVVMCSLCFQHLCLAEEIRPAGSAGNLAEESTLSVIRS